MNAQNLVRWNTLNEAEKKVKTEKKKKIMVDVYTSWCGWCKKMDSGTFNTPYVAEYLNNNFYSVKLDAETKNDIAFQNKVYKFVNGSNELAYKFLNGQMSYPSVVFLDENLNIIQAIPGYRSAEEFEKIISYFAQNGYQKMPYTRYEKEYKRSN